MTELTPNPNGNSQPAGYTNSAANTSVLPPKKSKKKWVIIFTLVIVAALLGGGWAYAAILQPKSAITNYLKKLSAAESGAFSGTVNVASSENSREAFGILQSLDLSFRGQYSGTNAEDGRLKVEISGGAGGVNLSGEVIAIARTLYFKINDTQILEDFGIPITDTWYKYELDQSLFSDSECADDEATSSVSIFSEQIITNLPLKDTKLVKLRDSVDGKKVRHFSGAIDMQKLPSVIEDANKNLPADCQLSVDKNNTDDIEITYELWKGKNFDRLKLNIVDTSSNTKVTVTLDTSNYNQPVEISAPEGARDFKEILEKALNTTFESFPGDTEILEPPFEMPTPSPIQ